MEPTNASRPPQNNGNSVQASTPNDQANTGTLSSMFWGAVECITGIPTALSKRVRECFVDGKHDWKQKKYFLCLKAIIENFPKERMIALQEKLERLPPSERTALIDHTLALAERTLQIAEWIEKTEQNLPLQLFESGEEETQIWGGIHQQWVESLRVTLQTEGFDKEVQKALKNEPFNDLVVPLLHLCDCRFNQVNFYEFYDSVVEMMIKEGLKVLYPAEEDRSLLPEDVFELPLSLQFDAIKTAPLELRAPTSHIVFKKLRGFLNILFDPTKDGGNTPYHFGDLPFRDSEGCEKLVRIIRTGTPTKQRTDYNSATYQGEAEIVPEFRNFIYHLAKENKSMLFVSLQDDREWLLGNEVQRNTALKKFHSELPNTFQFMILSHDTPFYHQSGPLCGEKSIQKNQFINMYLDEIKNEEAGFYFPSNWLQDPQFFETLKKILHEVCSDLYGEEQSFNVDQRKDCITIAYCYIILFCLRKGKADHLLICCKDSADRTLILLGLLSHLGLIWSNKEGDKEQLRIRDVNTHAPAMLVKKQEMRLDRRERLLSILEAIKDPAVLHRIKEKKDWSGVLDCIQVERNPEQRIQYDVA